MNLPKLPDRPVELPTLEARRAKIRGESKAIERELARLQTEVWDAQQGGVDALDRAAALVAAGEVEATAREALPEQGEVLRTRLELLTRADSKLTQDIAELRDTYNRQVARAFRPAHRQAARRIAKALTELVRANEAEQHLRASVPGVQLRPADFPNTGGFGPHGGAAQVWLDYARREGLLDDDDNWPMAAE